MHIVHSDWFPKWSEDSEARSEASPELYKESSKFYRKRWNFKKTIKEDLDVELGEIVDEEEPDNFG